MRFDSMRFNQCVFYDIELNSLLSFDCELCRYLKYRTKLRMSFEFAPICSMRLIACVQQSSSKQNPSKFKDNAAHLQLNILFILLYVCVCLCECLCFLRCHRVAPSAKQSTFSISVSIWFFSVSYSFRLFFLFGWSTHSSKYLHSKCAFCWELLQSNRYVYICVHIKQYTVHTHSANIIQKMMASMFMLLLYQNVPWLYDTDTSLHCKTHSCSGCLCVCVCVRTVVFVVGCSYELFSYFIFFLFCFILFYSILLLYYVRNFVPLDIMHL